MQGTTLQAIFNKGKINHSQLKIIACICMLLSHFLECYGWKGWGIIKGNDSAIFEMIGQIAFPLFSFGIVCSIEKSQNIQFLINRLLFLAVVSQIPFTMALYPANLQRIGSMDNRYYFSIPWGYIIIFFVIILGICIKNNQISKTGISFLVMAGVLSSFNLCIQYFWINYTDRLNVGFLYWGSIVVLGMIRSWKESGTIEKIGKFLSISSIIIFLISRADCGISGFILIVIFYLLRRYRMFQCIGLILWGIIVYGIVYSNHPLLLISSVVSAILISRYNDERGRGGKWLFYVLYPLHLWILGMVNLYFKWI